MAAVPTKSEKDDTSVLNLASTFNPNHSDSPEENIVNAITAIESLRRNKIVPNRSYCDAFFSALRLG